MTAPAATRHVTWLRGPFPRRQLLALACTAPGCGFVTDWHELARESHAAGEMRDHLITRHPDAI